jgi:hypothetical protein
METNVTMTVSDNDSVNSDTTYNCACGYATLRLHNLNRHRKMCSTDVMKTMYLSQIAELKADKIQRDVTIERLNAELCNVKERLAAETARSQAQLHGFVSMALHQHPQPVYVPPPPPPNEPIKTVTRDAAIRHPVQNVSMTITENSTGNVSTSDDEKPRTIRGFIESCDNAYDIDTVFNWMTESLTIESFDSLAYESINDWIITRLNRFNFTVNMRPFHIYHDSHKSKLCYFYRVKEEGILKWYEVDRDTFHTKVFLRGLRSHLLGWAHPLYKTERECQKQIDDADRDEYERIKLNKCTNPDGSYRGDSDDYPEFGFRDGMNATADKLSTLMAVFQSQIHSDHIQSIMKLIKDVYEIKKHQINGL